VRIHVGSWETRVVCDVGLYETHKFYSFECRVLIPCET